MLTAAQCYIHYLRKAACFIAMNKPHTRTHMVNTIASVYSEAFCISQDAS